MPNWCENRLYIEATHEDIAELIAVIEAQSGLLSYLRPEPTYPETQESQTMPAWYEWRVEHWGTKWDVSEVFGLSHDDTWLVVSFDSAWGPPVEAVNWWCEQNPEQRSYNLRYIEWGNAFCGEADSRTGDESFNIPATSDEVINMIPDSLNEEFGIAENLEMWEKESELEA
jgi:hypothetical protein